MKSKINITYKNRILRNKVQIQIWFNENGKIQNFVIDEKKSRK